MANDLTTTNAAAPASIDRPKWLTPTETSALADRGTILPFNPRAAVAAFDPDRLSELVLRYDAALIPADDKKLAARLRAMWESTTAPQNLTAKTWLHEAGRLLADLPYGIAHRAIDQAVLASERGFTPSIAAIRAIADPMVAELRRCAARLHAVQDASRTSPCKDSADHPHAPGPLETRTTAEILADTWPTIGDHVPSSREQRGGLDPNRTCRAPTREDYLRMGVPAAVLDAEPDEAGQAAAA